MDEFIKNFANLLEDTDPAEITGSTVFKDLDEWSSLMSLSLIAMVDEEYNVALRGDEIRNSSTIEDLYNKIKSKL